MEKEITLQSTSERVQHQYRVRVCRLSPFYAKFMLAPKGMDLAKRLSSKGLSMFPTNLVAVARSAYTKTFNISSSVALRGTVRKSLNRLEIIL